MSAFNPPSHRQSRRFAPLAFLLAAAALAFASAAAQAIEVEQVFWGFNQTYLPGRFTPVSVLLTHRGPETWTGTITLEQRDHPPQRIDTAITPGVARWVQFNVKADTQLADVNLSWKGASRGEYALVTEDGQDVNAGKPARVLLGGGGVDSGSRPGALQRFPEQLFPPGVTSLDALQSLVIDHSPRWSAAQQQALVDWVRSGGSLHLAWNSEGKLPTLSDELAALNSPLPVRRIGAGRVFTHEKPATRVTDADLIALEGTSPADTGTTNPYGNPDYTITTALRSLTETRHAWGVIFLLGAAYLFLIGPVNWWYGRRVNDFRLAAGLLLAFIAAFGLTFFFVGRRGYGESATTHTLTYARPLAGNAYDVTQWSQVFVTQGGTYNLTHEGEHNLYGMASYEPVAGEIRNGQGGGFIAEIPLFSWRELVHRGRMEGPPVFTVTVEATADVTSVGKERQAVSESLPVLRPGPGFPAKPTAVWLVRGQDCLALNRRADGAYVPVAESKKSLQKTGNSALGRAMQPRYISNRGEQMTPEQQELYVVERYTTLATVVAARAMNLNLTPDWGYNANSPGNQATPAPPTPDKPRAMELFVLAPNAEFFQLRRNAPGLGKEAGYILYHLTLPEEQP